MSFRGFSIRRGGYNVLEVILALERHSFILDSSWAMGLGPWLVVSPLEIGHSRSPPGALARLSPPTAQASGLRRTAPFSIPMADNLGGSFILT